MIFISKPPWQHAQGQMCSSTGASIFLREGQMVLESISSWQWHGKTPKPSALLETCKQRKPRLQCPSFHQSQIIYLNSFRAPLLGKVVKGHEMMKFAPKPRGGDGLLAHSADSLQPRPFWGGKTPRSTPMHRCTTPCGRLGVCLWFDSQALWTQSSPREGSALRELLGELCLQSWRQGQPPPQPCSSSDTPCGFSCFVSQRECNTKTSLYLDLSGNPSRNGTGKNLQTTIMQLNAESQQRTTEAQRKICWHVVNVGFS